MGEGHVPQAGAVKKFLKWSEYATDLGRLCQMLKWHHLEQPFDEIVGIARGGTVPATIVSYYLGLPMQLVLVHPDEYPPRPRKDQSRLLIVDDLSDSGETFKRVINMFPLHPHPTTAALYSKPETSLVPDFFVKEVNEWVVFPYEQDPDRPFTP